MTARPAGGRTSCALSFGAALGCLWLAVFDPSPARAQTLTADLFNPRRGAFVPTQQLPFRKIGDDPADDSADASGPAPDLSQPLGQA